MKKINNIFCILLMLISLVYISGCTENSKQAEQINKMQSIAPGAKIGGEQKIPIGNVGKPAGNVANSKIGELHQRILEGGKVIMLLPDEWNTQIFPGCTGLVTVDGSNAARAVIFMNGLHQSIDPLPAGVTPEDYLTKYMQKDFKTVSDVRIIKYEDADLSNLRAGGGDVKAIRISFKNNGVPAIGSFTVNTYGTSMSSAVGYLWGVTSTENEFESDGLTLLKIFSSIKYDEQTLQGCRDVLKGSWGIKD